MHRCPVPAAPNRGCVAALRIGLDSKRMMINVFDTSRGAWRALQDAHHVNEPSWSHDSRYIYYDTEGEEPRVRGVTTRNGGGA
jgi:hypothetical protein